MSWLNRAACRDADPELFYSRNPAEQRQAVAICARCPVPGDCLRDAIVTERAKHTWIGIRAGLTAVTRRRLVTLGPASIKPNAPALTLTREKGRTDLAAFDRQVARLQQDGMSIPQVAEELQVSTRTVERARRRLRSGLAAAA